MPRKLRVFLCHASQDKPAVRELYARLKSEPWIDPWLDEENLLAGQDFDLEIYRATRDADAMIICLSRVSVAKEGYVNKEIRRALEIAQEKPEGTIYVIPLRLDDCTPSFEQLKKLHWADYFTPNAHERLVRSLRVRAEALNLEISEKEVVPRNFSSSTAPAKDDELLEPKSQPAVLQDFSNVDFDLYQFIEIAPTQEVPYSFHIGKYPVTNAQYERFLKAPDFAERSFWVGPPKYNEECIQVGRWGAEGWNWLQDEIKESGNPLKPKYWDDENLGISNPENPVVEIAWFEANAYCNWLKRHWEREAESRANAGLKPKLVRLPLEIEWSIAAGGEKPDGRYPWDTGGKVTKDIKEIARRANVSESKIGHTTPVNAFWRGASPPGVMDMAGNVWEWQANYINLQQGWLALRGGSWYLNKDNARVSSRLSPHPDYWDGAFGFRVVCLPSGRS
jgi:formylglycine-generating enzyme required for sulfatase activity